jgi:hypothetical protein
LPCPPESHLKFNLFFSLSARRQCVLFYHRFSLQPGSAKKSRQCLFLFACEMFSGDSGLKIRLYLSFRSRQAASVANRCQICNEIRPGYIAGIHLSTSKKKFNSSVHPSRQSGRFHVDLYICKCKCDFRQQFVSWHKGNWLSVCGEIDLLATFCDLGTADRYRVRWRYGSKKSDVINFSHQQLCISFWRSGWYICHAASLKLQIKLSLNELVRTHKIRVEIVEVEYDHESYHIMLSHS